MLIFKEKQVLSNKKTFYQKRRNESMKKLHGVTVAMVTPMDSRGAFLKEGPTGIHRGNHCHRNPMQLFHAFIPPFLIKRFLIR